MVEHALRDRPVIHCRFHPSHPLPCSHEHTPAIRRDGRNRGLLG
jgi:hypothetical protein